MSMRPLELLLVEDNPGDVRLIREALGSAALACRLHVARNGVEGLDFLFRRDGFEQAPDVDLVLLDLNLPLLGGREVLVAIRAQPRLAKLPVMVLTSSDADADVLASYAVGADRVIPKPLEFSGFTVVIDAIRQVQPVG